MTTSLRRVLPCLLLLWLSNPVYAQKLVTSIDDKTGWPVVEVDGQRALRPSWLFWRANWQFATTSVHLRTKDAAKSYTVSADVPAMTVGIRGAWDRVGAASWSGEIVVSAQRAIPDAIGGGLQFDLDLANLQDLMGDPELLPGNTGWRWGRIGGPKLQLTFDPALPMVKFERGQKSVIRAFFFKDGVSAAEKTYKVTWSVSGFADAHAVAADNANGADSPWPKDALPTDAAPPELGWLNNDDRPAGRRGWVTARGDQLVYGDGTPARLWGTNLTANALFATTREDVKLQAKRLAALGFNLVRLHHHDSGWVQPNVFGRSRQRLDTQTLDADAMDHLDWWIKCLRDEGIYVWLDLHVGREFKAGDKLDGFDEIRKGKDYTEVKGFSYLNSSVRDALKRFNRAYLQHRNSYTGLRPIEDPALLSVLITNENDLTQHFGNAFLPDKGVPYHQARFATEVTRFAAAHDLPEQRVGKTWEPGPSKLLLNDLEHRFNVDMIGDLRSIGLRSLIATTSSWGRNPLLSLPSLTDGDVIDAHAYGQKGTLAVSPLRGATLAHWIGAAQVVGMPLTVTEWNAEPFPVADRHVLPLYLAATASHQGWDALMQYAYTQVPPRLRMASNWHAFNDPSLLTMLPAAALVFREGHVQAAKTNFVFDQAESDFFSTITSAGNSRALRTAMEIGRLSIAMPVTKDLPWLTRHPVPQGAKRLVDPAQTLLPPDATSSTSDTGELTRSWSDGIYTIATPRTRAILGNIGGKEFDLGGVTVALANSSASVAVQSLDSRPLSESRSIMISLGTRSVPGHDGQAPFLIEPAKGRLTIKAPVGLALFDRPHGGTRLPSKYFAGSYEMELDGATAMRWLFLRARSDQ